MSGYAGARNPPWSLISPRDRLVDEDLGLELVRHECGEAACKAVLADPAVIAGLEKQKQPIGFRDRAGLAAFVADEFKTAQPGRRLPANTAIGVRLYGGTMFG